jgi:hypothetical protein
MRSQVKRCLGAATGAVIASAAFLAVVSSPAGAGPPMSRTVTANAAGTATGSRQLGTHTDAGTYTSTSQLGIGRYQFSSTFHPTAGCGGVVSYTGTARLTRSDGATLSGTLTGTSQCIGFVEGLVEVDASYTLDLTTGTRDFAGAQLTADCSWPIAVTSAGGRGREQCTFSGNANFTTLFGYDLLDAAGTVTQFGGGYLHFQVGGVFGATRLAVTPSRQGYWIVDSSGHVFAFGDARWLGNAGEHALLPSETVRSISPSAGGKGYWLFTSRGRALPFGAARFLGDMTGEALNGPVVDAVATADGLGYLMVGSDGGIFTFGDAHYYGSTGDRRLNQPVVAIAPTESGHGYWLVASDGGVFSFGDAQFRGSMGATRLARPVVGITRYGRGYLMVASDGGIFNFGTLAFFGSLAGESLETPVVAVAAT